jgi:hypothetical protein
VRPRHARIPSPQRALDELYITLTANPRQAVDQEGEIVENYVTDKEAALTVM